VETLPGAHVLTSLEPGEGCALGGLSIDGVEAGELTDHLLEKYSIHVRPRYVPGEFSCIRVTPNVYNTLQEIDTFSSAITKIAGEQ